jgi:translation initiation factor 1 (eIF-1/SUI1)
MIQTRRLIQKEEGPQLEENEPLADDLADDRATPGHAEDELIEFGGDHETEDADVLSPNG